MHFILPKWMNLIFSFMLIGGFIFILWQDSEITRELKKRKWPHTEGKILESEIIGDRAIRNEITYQYKVDNKFYQGTSDYNIPGFGNKNYRRKTARILKNKNPVGLNIDVCYNPEAPEISTLRYGPYWSNYMIIGFGGMLFGLGLFGLTWHRLIFVSKTKKSKETI